MRRFRSRMRPVTLFILAMGLAGCAAGSERGPVVEPSRTVFRDATGGRQIVLDRARMTIERDGRSVAVEDCSNDEYFCLRAEDWFVFAYPRRCPSLSEIDQGLRLGGLIIENRAPSPHRPSGSGLYFSRSVPRGQFVYDMDLGLVSLTLSSVQPHDPRWEGPEEVYSRTSHDRSPPAPLFACSPQG